MSLKCFLKAQNKIRNFCFQKIYQNQKFKKKRQEMRIKHLQQTTFSNVPWAVNHVKSFLPVFTIVVSAKLVRLRPTSFKLLFGPFGKFPAQNTIDLLSK